jgi:hypothetical protein
VNCGEPVNSKYCPNCGQKKDVGRLSFQTLYADLQFKLFGLDSKYFKTFIDLTYKPGKVLKSYLSGNRIQYAGPVPYFFVAITLLVLLITLLNIDMVGYTAPSTNALNSGLTDANIERQHIYQEWIFKHYKFLNFLLIPVYVLAARLLFRKDGYNLLENSAFMLYAYGHPQIITYLSLIIFKISGYSLAPFVSLISALYAGYFAMKFYEHGPGWLRFIKGVLIFPLTFLFIMLIVVAFVVLIELFFPDTAKSMFFL